MPVNMLVPVTKTEVYKKDGKYYIGEFTQNPDGSVTFGAVVKEVAFPPGTPDVHQNRLACAAYDIWRATGQVS